MEGVKRNLGAGVCLSEMVKASAVPSWLRRGGDGVGAGAGTASASAASVAMATAGSFALAGTSVPQRKAHAWNSREKNAWGEAKHGIYCRQKKFISENSGIFSQSIVGNFTRYLVSFFTSNSLASLIRVVLLWNYPDSGDA